MRAEVFPRGADKAAQELGMIAVMQVQDVGWAKVRSARTASPPAWRSTVPTRHESIARQIRTRGHGAGPFNVARRVRVDRAFAHPTALDNDWPRSLHGLKGAGERGGGLE